MHPKSAKGKGKATSSSPVRELAMQPASSSTKSGHAVRTEAKEIITLDDDDEEETATDRQPEEPIQPKAHKEEATGLSEPDIDHGNVSDTGSFQSDSLDPAMFDEEEMPDEAGTSATPGGSKPGYQGGFNAMKMHNGQYYSGMGIGMSHNWNYQPGTWIETKREPDRWEVDYNVEKRRNHNAPTGSGAPVGTEYHWLIVGHQMVKKTDANTYETHLTGHKYKLAHKSVGQKNWSIPTVKGQREREIFLLNDAIRRIEGLPPVLSNEKIKVDKKEKGQATLGNFFTNNGVTPKKRKGETAEPESVKKAKSEEGIKSKDMA